MRIGHIIEGQHTSISFEFFPPKTEAGWNKLFVTISQLVPLHPSFVSVTYGAGGTTRQRTHELVERLKTETSITVAAHLTCFGSTREELEGILARYEQLDIKNIVALRGDPRRSDGTEPPGDFKYASQLVALIKNKFPSFDVAVAGYPEGHPETNNRLLEMDHLKAKIDAGADYIITQMFFDNRDFYDYCERCDLAGIRVPIIAGIMPVTSIKGMERMAELAKRCRFPSGLLRAINRAQGEEYVKRVGVHWAAEQVRDLLDNNVAGIHFYTLNTSDASLRICETLGLRDFAKIVGPDAQSIEMQRREGLAAGLMMGPP